MLPIEFWVLIVIILTLVVLVIGSYTLLAVVCWRILSTIDHRMRSIDSSQTTQEQYMYGMRGEISRMARELNQFFAVYGYVNPAWLADQQARAEESRRATVRQGSPID